ncbi:hypothetical protein C7E19_24675 [Stenotrophomonas maltophilia]|nr:hypothetical protein C7E19_24675 [Stenotrophomonas maltophilia]
MFSMSMTLIFFIRVTALDNFIHLILTKTQYTGRNFSLGFLKRSINLREILCFYENNWNLLCIQSVIGLRN